MSLLAWVGGFAALHARARDGGLPAEEFRHYLEQRDELARMMVGAQALTARPGQKPRRALRVARPFPVDLVVDGVTSGSTTLDVSSGGFSCLAKVALAAGTRVRFSMRLPHGETVAGVADAVGCRAQGDLHRVALHIVEMSEDQLERLELAVFDAVVEIIQA